MNQQIMSKIFPEQMKLVADGKCPLCGADIDLKSFRDELSRREFKISGLCQACMDKIFKN